jgi:hypothetical protein
MDPNQLDPKIIEKIQKLLNLKEGAEAVGSVFEAENAASRLQEMLMRYNLDLESVKASKIEQKAEMFDDIIWLHDKADKREADWVPKLYYAIARNNLCRAYPYKTHIHIIGEKHQVMLVQYIAEQLISKIRIAEKLAWNIYDKKCIKDLLHEWQREKRGTYRRGFFQGAAHGIDQRLERDREEMEHTHNPFAVMIINKRKVVDDYMDEKYYKPHQEREDAMSDEDKAKRDKRNNKLAKRKGPKGISSADGWRNGYDAGLQMDVNKGLDQNKTDTKSIR